MHLKNRQNSPNLGAWVSFQVPYSTHFSALTEGGFFKFLPGDTMNLNISGHHLEITPAIRDYVAEKLDRVKRHFDQVMDAKVIMQVEKLVHKVEVTLHVSGRDFHAHAEDSNMYAAIDMMVDKLDRQIVKHKEKNADHHPEGAVKRQVSGM
jgi:putative sigma-54 modulation protein